MEIINLNEIDLSSLQKLKNQGTQSTIYTDGTICYKFLNGLYPDEKIAVERKFRDMEGIKINGVLLPQSLIFNNGKLEGYTNKYLANSIPLSDKFEKNFFNCNELLTYVKKASKILRNIHKNNIGYQDLSFENILVDENGNITFCDIDNCTYKNYHSAFYSKLFKEFLIDYRNCNIPSVKDVDKISLILSFYLTMYGQVLQKITKKQDYFLTSNINTLKNLKKIKDILIDKKCPLQNMPYIDEFIDLKDNYEINRKKFLNLKQRIFKNY